MYRVLIRPLAFKDAGVSYVWRNDPEIWEYTGKRPDRIITREMEEAWIKKVLSEDDSCRFAIEADGKYIGNIQITNIEKNNHIITYYDMLKTQNNFYFVYEYCNGGTLEGMLRKQNQLD